MRSRNSVIERRIAAFGLREISGHSGRMALSHDMTFLALLLGSLEEPSEREETPVCPVHPLRKQSIIRSTAVDYAAAMNLLLMYYKCEDKVRDDHSPAGAVGQKALQSGLNRVRTMWPRQAEGVAKALDALWAEETRSYPSPDRLSNLSGEMLGAVFVPDADDCWAPALRGLGEGLGRFVYWMDAWEDREADRRHHRFNPLDHLAEQENLEEFVREALEMLMGEATEYFETLPLEKDLDLLRNVLYSGVWQRYNTLQARRNKEKKE